VPSFASTVLVPAPRVTQRFAGPVRGGQVSVSFCMVALASRLEDHMFVSARMVPLDRTACFFIACIGVSSTL